MQRRWITFLVMLAAMSALQANANPIWSYDGGSNGEDTWNELSPDYATCLAGTSQSPVMLSYTQPADLPPLSFEYSQSPTTLSFEDYTIVLGPQHESMLEGKHRYTLTGIRFHSPSEHVIHDKFFPVEVELMHEDAEHHMLILSVFMDAGAPNKALQSMLSALPEHTAITGVSLPFDPAGLLPASYGYYAYSGSLTYPPCTEGVEWRILKQHVTLSKDQLDRLTYYIGRNARLSQPIYMRIIKESK